ncbi:MAG: iron-containing redox enzyme family protein [Nitrososphaerales archaeon]
MEVDYIATEEYEREVRREFEPLFDRQLPRRDVGIHGNYLPSLDIYSIGWRGWRDLPAADFVASLTGWHDGFIRDRRDEPFFPFFSPLIYNGELSPSELRTHFELTSGQANLPFYYEGIAHFRAHLAGLREIRDFIAWHLFEETGHNEMLGDFMEGYFGMNRKDEVHPLSDPLKIMEKDRAKYERLQRFKALNVKGHFVEVAAAAMLRERILPKTNRLNSIGLRKHYDVPDRYMVFFDVHRFIDIYHERFGQYILGKYATDKDLQQRAESIFKDLVQKEYEADKRLYNSLPVSKR